MLTTKLRGVSTAWRVLLVDGTSLKIVSSCVKMSDLAEANVSGACDETRDEMDRTTRGEKAPPPTKTERLTTKRARGMAGIDDSG